MTGEVPQHSPEKAWPIDWVLSYVERKYRKGSDHFDARGFMASMAILVATDHRTVLPQTYTASMDLLRSQGASAELYAYRHDAYTGRILENGEPERNSAAYDTYDRIRIIARNGVPTDAQRDIEDGELIVRVRTDPTE